MSVEIETLHYQEYRSSLDILLQQRRAKLRGTVRVETISGEKSYFDRIGPKNAKKKTTRHADTELTSTPHDRREVSSSFYYDADLLDKDDELRILGDPTNRYAQNSTFALNRAMDDEVILAMFGDAKAGKTGQLTVTFPVAAGNNVAAGGVGMTTDKFKEASEKLRAFENDPEEEAWWACMSSKQLKDMWGQTEFISRDFFEKTLETGISPAPFLGFRIKVSERLAKVGSDRVCGFWAQSGMLLGVNMDIEIDIGRRRDKHNAIQVYAGTDIGSVRMEEKKVIKVLAQE